MAAKISKGVASVRRGSAAFAVAATAPFIFL
jgi:hypothetical protein